MTLFIRAFIFGAIALFGALIVQTFILTLVQVFGAQEFFAVGATWQNALPFFAMAALSEEIMRGALALRFIAVTQPTRALVVGCVFGAGFASVEVVIAMTAHKLAVVPPLTIVTTVGIHILLSTLFFGIFVKNRTIPVIMLTITGATCLHIVYNLFLL